MNSSPIKRLFKYMAVKDPKRVLVMRTSRLGDFICAMPALNILRERFPYAEIALLTASTTNRALQGREGDGEWLRLLRPGVIDRVIAFSVHDIKTLKGLGRLRSEVKGFNPDLSFILPFSGNNCKTTLKKALFLRILGVKENLFGLWAANNEEDALHQVLAPLSALKEAGICGITERDIFFDIYIDPVAKKMVDELWERLGLAGKVALSVFPGATFAHKRWHLENFRVLCRRLLQTYPVEILVIGGKNELELCGSIASLDRRRVHNLAGRTGIMEAGEVLRRSIALIGNDSGISHLSSAVGTPVITVFSNVHPEGVWEPWNFRELAIRADVACRHCREETNCPKGTNECITAVSIENVLKVCTGVLERHYAVFSKDYKPV